MAREIGTSETRWSNPSVLKLAGKADPISVIVARARELVLEAQERGWTGPPFDPFTLAEKLGIKLRAREGVEDARLVMSEGQMYIEFNPSRPHRRMRFSVAHEIGHWLFPDAPEQVRYRSHFEGRRQDDWQLETLCNVAAAEILVPIGGFPELEDIDLDLNLVLDEQRRYDVSIEALLLRVVKLTAHPVLVFCARRDPGTSQYRFVYLVASRSWESPIAKGAALPSAPVLEQCSAIGFTAKGNERWGSADLRVQAVGAPPFPGETDPRVLGFASPLQNGLTEKQLDFVRGDVTHPRGDGPRLIGHVVNNRSKSWRGARLSSTLLKVYPEAHESYEDWAETGRNRELGAVHLVQADEDLWICSMVAQEGYGRSAKPRIRYGALQKALENLARHARELGASVHIPLLGTGQGRGEWPLIKELIYEALGELTGRTTIYVLPEATLPEDAVRQLSLID